MFSFDDEEDAKGTMRLFKEIYIPNKNDFQHLKYDGSYCKEDLTRVRNIVAEYFDDDWN